MSNFEVSVYFREYRLGDLATEFVKGNIQKYGLSLGEQLLQHVDFADGEVVTYAPTNINDEENRLDQFEHGHLLNSLPREVKDVLLFEKLQPDFDLWLSPIVQKHLESSINALCVFTDIDVKPNHPIMQRSFMHSRTFRDEVYFLLTHEHSMPEDIDEAFCEVGSWSLVCALTIHPKVNDLVNKTELDLLDLNVLVANVQKVIVMAYDGEGYLIWYKS